MIDTATGHPTDARRDLHDLHALVATALERAAPLSADPAFRQWCDAYRFGARAAFSERTARQALTSVWPDLAAWPLHELIQRMEADARGSLCAEAAGRWAMAGAARAACEFQWTRHVDGKIGADRRRQVGLVASMAVLFAATARERRDVVRAACGAGG